MAFVETGSSGFIPGHRKPGAYEYLLYQPTIPHPHHEIAQPREEEKPLKKGPLTRITTIFRRKPNST